MHRFRVAFSYDVCIDRHNCYSPMATCYSKFTTDVACTQKFPSCVKQNSHSNDKTLSQKKIFLTIQISAFIFSHWSIFSRCTIIAGFLNNFQDHRRVSEQLLRHMRLSESRNKLSEEGYWKDFTISK
jgi:hypothetical protein